MKIINEKYSVSDDAEWEIRKGGLYVSKGHGFSNLKRAKVYAINGSVIVWATTGGAEAIASAPGSIARATNRGAKAYASKDWARAYATVDGAVAWAIKDGAEAWATVKGAVANAIADKARSYATVDGARAYYFSK